MKYLILAVLLGTLAACSDQQQFMGKAHRMVTVADTAEAKPEGRHIAYSYNLHYEAPAEVLMQRFAAIEAECIKLKCSILKASRDNTAGGESPSAELSARIAPAALPAFLNSTAAANTLTSQTRSSEDKTIAVIDAEAKIKNLTALKTRILQLLEQRAGNLADVLAAEKQLGEIQTQLDTIAGVRQMLALETEMVKVDISLTTQSSVSRGSWFHPVATALDKAVDVLMGSLGMLILFLVGAIPWAIVLVPLVWWMSKVMRNRRLRREARAAGV